MKIDVTKWIIAEHPVIKKVRYLFRYSIALFIPFLIFLLLNTSFSSYISQSTSLLFFAGVIISTLNGGYKAGILTTILSAFLLNYYFTLPYGTQVFTQLNGIVKFVFFVGEGVIFSIVIDVVGRRTAIAEYKDVIKELKKEIEEKEKANSLLRKEIRSRDEFLSIASHELKTPLTSMLLQTQHALHNIKNVSLAQFSIQSLLKMLENVENQTKRLSKMINDFLNISLITTGNLDLNYGRVNLNETVKRVIGEFTPRLNEDNYTLNLHEKDTIEGVWDKTRLEQIISNLISNAIKYGEGKPIDITIIKDKNSAQVYIKDNGIGVPKSKHKVVFELFERGVSPEKYKGIGVGLFITHKMVKAHHGTLSFSSKENHGSIFVVTLPINSREVR